MIEYLITDKNKGHRIDDIKIENDYVKLYLNSKKTTHDLSFNDLIAAQILGSFTATMISFGLFVLILSLINKYIVSFEYLIPDYMYWLIPIIWFLVIYLIITKRKLEYIKSTICRESIRLGFDMYRHTLFETKKELKVNEFKKFIENECLEANGDFLFRNQFNYIDKMKLREK